MPPTRRGLSKEEAAEYCGVSPNTLIRHGPPPSKIGERSIWDRRVLDRWLDDLAGLVAGSPPAEDPEEQLLRAVHVRKTALRHSSR
jgi:hypothetical protein